VSVVLHFYCIEVVSGPSPELHLVVSIPSVMKRNKKQKSARKSGNNMRKNVSNPPGANIIRYNGPSRLPENVHPEIKTVELHDGSAVTSSAGGVIELNATSSNVRTLGDDFSSWALLYREYRVLAIRLEYHPDVLGATIAALLYKPIYTVVDRLDNSAVGAFTNIESNTSLRIFTLNQPWFREAKMEDTSEADFIAASADSTSPFSIKGFTTGVTATTTYGRILIRWVVQFRTRD